ncbi:Acyltransferase LovD [Madurella mycetomatis]|uniref:Acyltransferase LovD n=1 Tax=Madurella mycetomatis TaxID=100816 RepID=A0A175W3C0_9PEZI|nr:Acyltransferase LovD [Madurella mycetomatis]
MSPEFEARIQKAIDDGDIPGAVLLARDKSGKIDYTLSLGAINPSSPLTPSSTFVLASMTKLLTCIAVLQLVERNLITLDSDVAPHLPALAAQPVISGFDAATGSPILTPRSKPILLRHLLSHSSGAGYVFLTPTLNEYFAATKKPMPIPSSPSSPGTVEARFDYPLVFEPGTSWAYGSGIDWAGRVVEVLTGTDLDTYLQAHVLDKVGVPPGGITFYPGRYPSTALARLAGMAERDAETGKLRPSEMNPNLSSGRAAFGGEGAYASLEEYMKVLYSILLDDGKLLQPETAQLLFEGLLARDPEAKKALQANMEHPDWVVGWVPTDTNGEYDWSAGGLLVDGDSHPHRKRGFLQWGGMFNLSWFIDRTAGVCSIFGTQIRQPADPAVNPLLKAFEEEIYSKL